jgi:hypothetical protein
MKWRRVSEEEVLRVLDNPDHFEETIGERKNAYKLLGNRSLKVTYKDEKSDTVVITVIEKERNNRG